jgi:transketolase
MSYRITSIPELEKMANTLRRDVVEMVGPGQAGHYGGSFSSAELITALYFNKLNFDSTNPKMPERDRFLLSKGHVGVIQYAALARTGFFEVSELATLKKLGSRLQGHPDIKKTPGVEGNTGSLGQGLSIGLGMALGVRLDKLPSRVYVLIGDGELAEGQIWEAAMAAANFKADNLCAIVDRNHIQATDFTEKRMDSGDIPAKWAAFGWNVIEINGHDFNQILSAYDQAAACKGKPTVIVADTIKGKGVSFAENTAAFHNGTMTEEMYKQALEELK